MTASEFSRLLSGRCISKRKQEYLAKCPVHGDKRASLSISEGKNGGIVILCRSHGCDVKSILDVMGLGWSALFLGPPPGREARRIIHELDAQRDRKRLKHREAVNCALQNAAFWDHITNLLGGLMAASPDDEALSGLFAESLRHAQLFCLMLDRLDEKPYSAGMALNPWWYAGGLPAWNQTSTRRISGIDPRTGENWKGEEWMSPQPKFISASWVGSDIAKRLRILRGSRLRS